MLAVEYKTADIPAHNKHAYRKPNDPSTESIYIIHVFRRQVKRIRTKKLHECSVDRTKQNQPEQQQHLVFPAVQEQ